MYIYNGDFTRQRGTDAKVSKSLEKAGMATFDLPLNSEEKERYSRQLILPQVGVAGQQKLKAAKVLLVGAGGLGSPAALYLAAAGVGRMGIIDPDLVDVSNLQRQVLYGTDDTGSPKVDAAARHLLDLNPLLALRIWQERLDVDNALSIIPGFDLVLDGADNFATRYLVNDACVLAGVPNIHGSIHQFEGQAAIYGAPGGPCYRCLYPEPPDAGEIPSCAEAGVLGVLPGLIGTIQATEALKMILGIGEPLIGRVLRVNALDMRFKTTRLAADPECPLCGDHPTIKELRSMDSTCKAGGDDDENLEIQPDELRRRIEQGEAIFLLDVREPHEWDLSRIDGATLIPLRSLPENVDKLDADAHIVVYCHSGMRSFRATTWLRENGFPRVRNLAGGIVAWQQQQ